MMFGVSVAMALAARAGAIGFAHVALASVFGGIFWAADMPVRRRLLGDLAGGDLATAMSLDSATSNATRMIGPVLGGVVLQAFSLAGVFVLSAAVFAVSLAAIALTPVPGTPRRAQSTYFLRELISGIRFVAGDARLRWVLSVTVVFNVWGFPFTSMIPVIGAGRLGLDSSMVGLLSSAEGLGAFIGAVAVALAARPKGFAPLYLWGTAAYLALVGCLGVVSLAGGEVVDSFLAASGILLAVGLAGACFSAHAEHALLSERPAGVPQPRARRADAVHRDRPDRVPARRLARRDVRRPGRADDHRSRGTARVAAAMGMRREIRCGRGRPGSGVSGGATAPVVASRILELRDSPTEMDSRFLPAFARMTGNDDHRKSKASR